MLVKLKHGSGTSFGYLQSKIWTVVTGRHPINLVRYSRVFETHSEPISSLAPHYSLFLHAVSQGAVNCFFKSGKIEAQKPKVGASLSCHPLLSTNIPHLMIQVFTDSGDAIEITEQVVNTCLTFKDMVAAIDADDVSLPLPDISTPTLNLVIEYCAHYPSPPTAVTEWDKKFIANLNDSDTVFQLILAAEYLNVKPLLDAACLHIATLIRGKSPDTIRDMFGLADDVPVPFES